MPSHALDSLMAPWANWMLRGPYTSDFNFNLNSLREGEVEIEAVDGCDRRIAVRARISAVQCSAV